MSLKPCPFCGSEAEYAFIGNPHRGGYIGVRCTLCKASVVGCYYRGEPIALPLEETVGGEKAERNWNRRVNHEQEGIHYSVWDSSTDRQAN